MVIIPGDFGRIPTKATVVDSDSFPLYKADGKYSRVSAAILAGYIGNTNATRTRITSADSPYTITDDDEIILADATSGAIVVNLQAAATAPIKRYNVKKIDSSANTVTIDPDGSETIDGIATEVLTAQNESRDFIQDDTLTEWFIL